MIELDPIHRLTRDLASAAKTLSDQEARFLVDAYYTSQDNRIRSANQVRACTASGEPHTVLSWLFDQSETLEKQIKRALAKYVEGHKFGEWPLAQVGIGPVICAGLMAHIDINKAPTAGHIWSFAGIVADQKWNKGEKRPWNADLKRLSWLIGESFVKVSGNEDAVYGQMYAKRKAYEVAKNDAGDYKDRAEMALEAKKIGKDTDAYKAYITGKLPPAHIHARAKRHTVKLFLAHLHHTMYVIEFGKEPPLPYPIAILGHAHHIKPN